MGRGAIFSAMAVGSFVAAAGCTVIEVRAGSSVETNVHLGQVTVRTAGDEPVVIRQTTYGLQFTGQRFTIGYVDDLTVNQRVSVERQSLLVVGNVRKLGVPSCNVLYVDDRELQLCRILEDDK